MQRPTFQKKKRGRSPTGGRVAAKNVIFRVAWTGDRKIEIFGFAQPRGQRYRISLNIYRFLMRFLPKCASWRENNDRDKAVAMVTLAFQHFFAILNFQRKDSDKSLPHA